MAYRRPVQPMSPDRIQYETSQFYAHQRYITQHHNGWILIGFGVVGLLFPRDHVLTMPFEIIEFICSTICLVLGTVMLRTTNKSVALQAVTISIPVCIASALIYLIVGARPFTVFMMLYTAYTQAKLRGKIEADLQRGT